MYGYTETSKRSSFKFGLNQNVFMTKCELVKENDQNFVQIEFTKDESTIKTRIYEVTKAFKDGVEITDRNSEEFKKAVDEVSANLIGFIKPFVDIEVIKTALQQPLETFEAFANTLIRLLPVDYNTKPLDLFLQYQWTFKKNNEVTFLEIPKVKSYSGDIVIPHVEGEFEEILTDTSLKYISKDGIEHPFKRNKWYVNSNYAKRQEREVESSDNSTSDTEDIPF